MRVLICCVFLVGCHANLPPAPTSAASTPVDAELPRAPYEVVPAELGDANVHARIRHRVRLRRYGTFELERGVRPGGDRSERGGDTADVLEVIGETPVQIRVVAEDDHARIAVWIPRTDVRRTALVGVELGKGAGAAGAWVEPGAKLELGEVRGDRQAVAIVDDELLAVDGAIATRLLGHVWIATARDLAHEDKGARKRTSWSPPPGGPEAGALLEANELILAAPSTTANVIATVKARTPVAVLGVRGEFTEVEVQRPDLRVRGFVAGRVPQAPISELGTMHGGGHGFGMSHADHIEVPAGTCLFASVDGDVIGVQLEKQVRLGRLHPQTKDGAIGWRLVYVDSDWRVLELYVHDLADDPKQPRFDSCHAK